MTSSGPSGKKSAPGAPWLRRSQGGAAPGASRRRRSTVGLALAGIVGALLAVLPATAAAAAGQPAVLVSVTDASGTPITSVVPTLFGGEYQVRVSYTCTGDQPCTNMKVAIAAPPLDPYFRTQRKEASATWIPPYSPAPPITGDLASGYTVDLGTRPAGDTGVVTFRYTLKARAIAGCCGGNPIGWGNYFAPGYPIAPEVTVTSDGAATLVNKDKLATYDSVIPNPTLTPAVQTAVKSDVQMPVTVAASSACYNMSYAYGNIQSHYHELCGDTASVTVKLPTKASYVTGSGGTYDAAAHAVTFTTGPKATTGLPARSFKVEFPSESFPTSGAGCYVEQSFDISGSVTYLDGTKKPTPSMTKVTTVDNCQPFFRGTFNKTASAASFQIPNAGPSTPQNWLVDTYHEGNKPGVITITDNELDQPGMPVHKIDTSTTATIKVTLDNGATGQATGTGYTAPAGRHIVSATVASAPIAGPNLDESGTASERFWARYWFTVQPDATAGEWTNTASATISYPDYPDLPTYTPSGSPDSQSVELYTVTPFAKASASKNSSAASYDIRAADYNGSHWIVDVCNSANVQGVATITDDLLAQPGMPVYRITTSEAGATIAYTLSNGTTLTTTASDFSAPAGTSITKATVVSPPLAGPNSASTGTRCSLFRVAYYFTVKATATPGKRSNTASVRMEYPNTGLGTIVPTGSPATKEIALYNAPYTVTANAIAAPSNETSPGITPRAGDTVLWKASGRFCALTTDRSMTPQYVFLAPKGWNIRPDGAALAGDPGATFDYRTVTYNKVAYSAVVVQWPSAIDGSGPQAGDCYAMPELSVRTTPTLSAVLGTQTAQFFVGDAGDVTADAYKPTPVRETTTESDLDADGTTTDSFALSTGTSGLQGVAGLAVVKEICQPDAGAAGGCNWLADPAVTVGVPPNATSIKYRVTIRNNGQTNLTNVVAYDVLPYPGDTGTSTTSARNQRGSTVKEALSGLTVDSPTGMTLAYSTSTNPPRPQVFDGTTTGDWTAPMAGASAIRATIPTLAAGTSRTFTFDAALVGAAADQTACNSVAVSASTLVPSEPPRVCATTQEADFAIADTDHLPLQATRVGVVPFMVTNGGGSQSATASVTISVPAEVVVVGLEPDGWDCTAPTTTGPVDVTCKPVKEDGTARSLAKDTPERIELRVRPTASAAAELCFPASVEGLMHDPQPGDNSTESCSTALAAKPEIVVSKDDGRASASVGQELTYTLTASNWLVGEPVDGVTLTDTLPPSLELVSANPAPTSQVGQTLTWDLGRLGRAALPGDGGDQSAGNPEASKSVSVTVRVKPGTKDTITNTAEATGADPADSRITLSAEDEDVDSVTNVFTDEGAEEHTPQNTHVTTALADIVSSAGAPLDPTTVTQATASQHGSLGIDPTTGAVRYTPDTGYSGDDSYRVRVCDTSSPAQCSTATVVVHVGANVVDAIDDTVTTDAPDARTADVRANDTTESGQPLARPTVADPPSHGTAEVEADGRITYTPDAGTSGPDSYRYVVCDTSHPASVCDTATVTIFVDNIYVDSGITLTTPQNTSISTPLSQIVTTTGAPVDPATLSASRAPQHGTLSLDTATGVVSYTPAPGYAGPDSYALAMCDVNGSDCHVVTVPVTVQPNVVTADDDTAGTDAADPVTTDVRGNDTSASGQALADPTVRSGPDHGTAVVNGDGTVTYTPQAGFSGTDSYTYRVCDTSRPSAVCDDAAVTILVRNVFTDRHAAATTPHNRAVTTPLADIVSSAGAGVDPTTVTERKAPRHGSIDIDPTTGAVRYTPRPGYAGTDSYDVRVCDTSAPDRQCFTATVQVTVNPNVVDAVDDAGSTGSGDAVTTRVRSNDTSASGQPLAYPTVTAAPGHGTATVERDGDITYTPSTGFAGIDSYTYRVCDTSHPAPVCDVATVTVAVAAARFDLGLTNRLVSGSRVMAGGKVRYRLQVVNRGPDAVTVPIVLTDRMPRGMEAVSATGDGWRCKVEKRTDRVTCTRAPSLQLRGAVHLSAQETMPPVLVVGRTTARARGKLVNTATVEAAGDTVVANNRARVVVRVTATPPLPSTGFRVDDRGRGPLRW